MNYLIVNTSNNNQNKIVTGSTFENCLQIVESLGFAQYSISPFTHNIQVNQSNGNGFLARFNVSNEDQTILIFDSNETGAINWINSNYTSPIISSFSKTPLTLHTA